MKGLIHIYTGDGKGKTTAAVGLAVRMAGFNQNVLFAQFLKDGSSNEINVLENINHVEVFSCKKKLKFVFMMNEDEKVEAANIMSDYFEQIIQKAMRNKISLLILDEILDAIGTGMIQEKTLISFLKKRPESLEVVMNGRNPSENLLNLADYVTIMEKVKHPYDKNIAAREGIEY